MKIAKLLLLLPLCLLLGACASTQPQETETTDSPLTTDDSTSLPAQTDAPKENDEFLPTDNEVFSLDFAKRVLYLTAEADLTKEGYQILLKQNYDKAENDPTHTCAFTIASKSVYYEGNERMLVLVSIRGTGTQGEWISNFDFAPSHKNDIGVAENFSLAAQDIETALLPLIADINDPLLLLTGHSRGAATSNLLGLTLNQTQKKENIFVYTFATPHTYRWDENAYDKNIFNVINPADFVTLLPPGFDFHRVGTDILLDADPALQAQVAANAALMESLATTIEDYYETRYSLTEAGESKDGMTSYEIMLAFCQSVMLGQGTMPEIAENSHFYPIRQLVETLQKDGGMLGLQMGLQHMPSTYQSMMTAKAET